jgi:aspartyl-tRNA(Asn)/glutamyl-tRNA(Gln) amidotransferase subunit C
MRDQTHSPGMHASVASALACDDVSERITVDVVAKVSRLARLDLTAEEIELTTTQLSDMLEHFADIDALDLSDVTPMTQPYPLVNVMRDDVEAPVLDRDEVLAAAPQVEEGRFRVPPIVGLEG